MTQEPTRPESFGSSMAKGMNQASYGLSAAFGFVAAVVGLWLVGRWLDGVLGTEPWAQVVGAVAGWALGVCVVVYASRRGPG